MKHVGWGVLASNETTPGVIYRTEARARAELEEVMVKYAPIGPWKLVKIYIEVVE
jgi:hypothetical protein